MLGFFGKGVGFWRLGQGVLGAFDAWVLSIPLPLCPSHPRCVQSSQGQGPSQVVYTTPQRNLVPHHPRLNLGLAAYAKGYQTTPTYHPLPLSPCVFPHLQMTWGKLRHREVDVWNPGILLI